MPKLSEAPPPDLGAFRRLLGTLYEAYREAPPGSNRSALSKAKVSLACGMQDPGWLNKVIGGAPGCGNFRTETLVRFANVLELTAGDRKRLAQRAGRPVAPFNVPVISKSLETISMRRAVLLISADRIREAAETIGAVVSHVPRVSMRLSRVFGAHDIILRVTVPPDHLVMPDIVDRIRNSLPTIATDTLIVRDDVAFVAGSQEASTLRSKDPQRSAYVFLRNARDHHDDVIASMLDAARPLGTVILTAAILVGRFDAVAEISVERLHHLDAFVQTLKRSLTGSPGTITYPTVQVFQELTQTQW